MKIILLRHGQVEGNRERRYIGRTDQPLCEAGILQARAAVLPAADRIYSSPYLRCLQTARLVFPKQEPIVRDDLRECDFGVFEGKTADELANCPEYRAWVDGGCTGPIPGGESIDEFKIRCCRAFEAVVREESGKCGTLAFVIHGGVIMSLLERFDSRKRDYYFYRIGNCEYVGCDCSVSEKITLTVSEDAV